MIWLLNETLILMAVLIFFSGFFAFAEVVFLSLSVSQINKIKRDNQHLLSTWENNPNQILATLLLSNNAINIAVGVVSTRFSTGLAQHMEWPISLTVIGVGFISGLLVLIFGEILPKVIARYLQARFIKLLAPIINSWNQLITPISNLSVRLANLILGWVPKRYRISSFYDENFLSLLFKNSSISSSSHKILKNIIEFSSSKVTDIMMPYEKIFSITLESSREEAIYKTIRSGYSRIPVFSKKANQIIGLLYSKDLLAAWRNESLFILEDLIRPIFRIPADTKLPDLLKKFRTGHYHLALVTPVGDQHKTIGIVTLHDALESLVGDIREEF